MPSFHNQYLAEPPPLVAKDAGTDFREWSAMANEPAEALCDLFCSFIDTPVDGTGARCMVKSQMIRIFIFVVEVTDFVVFVTAYSWACFLSTSLVENTHLNSRKIAHSIAHSIQQANSI